MKVLATWIGTLLHVLESLIVRLRPYLIGHPQLHDPKWQQFQYLMLALGLTVLGSTLWASIYLIRVKDKGAHEKIGMAVNIYWFVFSAIGYGVVLLMPRAG
jgi:hypothetical protein